MAINLERKIIAVGAIIQSEDGKIIVVQETEDKSIVDKKVGDWGFPIETAKPGESVEKNLERLFTEEIGEIEVDYDLVSDWIGDYNGGNKEVPLWGRVFLVHYKGRSSERVSFKSVDGEVINHRWISPEEIFKLSRRKCASEPIRDFIEGRRGVVCSECLPGVRAI
ncbi:MAG: NUDIX hydrolase [Candidatus Shapirobacteria bacterium]